MALSLPKLKPAAGRVEHGDQCRQRARDYPELLPKVPQHPLDGGGLGVLRPQIDQLDATRRGL
jgi:hypothetical protein